MPKPPAEFSALATVRSIFSEATISFKCRATIERPGEAKMSPINSKLVKKLLKGRSAPLSRPSLRHLTPDNKGGIPRAPSGVSMAGYPTGAGSQMRNRVGLHDIEHWINF